MRRAIVIPLLAGAVLFGAWLLFRPRPAAVAPESPAVVAPVVPAPRAPVSPPERPTPGPLPSGPAWFTDMSADSGVDFVHQSGDSSEKPFPSANGSGLATFDFDLDRRPDLLFATGNPFPVDPATARQANRCYRNRGGWRFDDVTAPSGLGHRGYTHGVAVGDVDADGFPDLFLACYGADVLYRNNGDGTFAVVTSGVEDPRWSSTGVFFDADADGLLDLFVCRYGKWTPEDNPFCGDRARGRRVFCSPMTVEPEADSLWHNDGDGSFRDVTADAGLDGRPVRGLGVVATRLDDDEWIDLYVANDLNPNQLFLGGPDGRFRDASDLSGTAFDSLGRVKSSMGVDAADTTGSGRCDLIVTDFEGEYDLFFANAGGGTFHDASERSGIGPPGLPLVGWGVQFADFDADGREDLIIANGHVGDERREVRGADGLRQPLLVLGNRGTRFAPVPAASLGTAFTELHQGRAVVAADLDGDGDADLAFNHRDEPAALLRNDAAPAAAGPLPLLIRLVGTRGNRDAVGASATLRAASGPTQHRPVKGGGGYLSARDPRLAFSVPRDEPTAGLEIRWPHGRRSTVAGLAAGREYVVVEPAADDAAPTVVDLGGLR
ncbi:MAG: VCBS repeat-containing protein [Planctomycetes bacterium]|nr:VCBS repeat-containing protein [Planctomycetota bacterium]